MAMRRPSAGPPRNSTVFLSAVATPSAPIVSCRRVYPASVAHAVIPAGRASRPAAYLGVRCLLTARDAAAATTPELQQTGGRLGAAPFGGDARPGGCPALV